MGLWGFVYFYIYDSFVAERRHDRALANVETRLTDLGITGRIGRLNPFTNAKGLIRDEIKRGVKTVVAVGNDETVSQVVAGIGTADVTLGIIPLGEPNGIAESLGIPYGVDACDVLSKRVTQMIDLGLINGQHFLWQVFVPPGRVTLEGDGGYRVSPKANDCEIVVSNLRSADMNVSGAAAGINPGDPQDGLIDLLISPRRGGLFYGPKGKEAESTLIRLKKVRVMSDDIFTVLVDNRRLDIKEALIEIDPRRLKVISGRERLFAA
jgi:hypothetical protein